MYFIIKNNHFKHTFKLNYYFNQFEKFKTSKMKENYDCEKPIMIVDRHGINFQCIKSEATLQLLFNAGDITHTLPNAKIVVIEVMEEAMEFFKKQILYPKQNFLGLMVEIESVNNKISKNNKKLKNQPKKPKVPKKKQNYKRPKNLKQKRW